MIVASSLIQKLPQSTYVYVYTYMYISIYVFICFARCHSHHSPFCELSSSSGQRFYGHAPTRPKLSQLSSISPKQLSDIVYIELYIRFSIEVYTQDLRFPNTGNQ